MRDFQGNEIIKGRAVVFGNRTDSQLKIGIVKEIGKNGIDISLENYQSWRTGKDVIMLPESKPNNKG